MKWHVQLSLWAVRFFVELEKLLSGKICGRCMYKRKEYVL